MAAPIIITAPLLTNIMRNLLAPFDRRADSSSFMPIVDMNSQNSKLLRIEAKMSSLSSLEKEAELQLGLFLNAVHQNMGNKFIGKAAGFKPLSPREKD